MSLGAAALALLLLLAPALPAGAAELPAPSGFVSDLAGAVEDEQEAHLENRLADYARRSTNQVAVAVIASARPVAGSGLAAYANQLFNHWGVGVAGRDNGVLLLVAVDDRSSHIEVGNGLRDRLTADVVGAIVREQVAPTARVGDVTVAVEAGERAIRRALGDAPKEPVPAIGREEQDPFRDGRSAPGSSTSAPASSQRDRIALAAGGGVLVAVLGTVLVARRGRPGESAQIG